MPAPYGAATTAEELVSDYSTLIRGKIILVTGVSSGSLGCHFVRSLAGVQPAVLILAARNPDKLARVVSEIENDLPDTQTRQVTVDLGSLQSVREAAAEINHSNIPTIDVLVNNAGIMAVDFKLSPDGFESHLATNHLGPFLLTNLLMPKILASAAPRIVVISSDGHRLNPFRFHDYNFEDGKTYNKWFAYGQSKTANILFARSLAQKLGLKYNLQAYSLHPGVIWTNLGSHLDWNEDLGTLRNADKLLGNAEGWGEFNVKSIEQGAATHVFAAFDPGLKVNNGAYLLDCRVADPMIDTVKPWATSAFEAERLWVLSEKLVKEKFPY